MTEKEKQKIIAKYNKTEQKVFCQGCGKEIRENANLSDVQYVRTKRKSDIFFHTGCMDRIWKRKIAWRETRKP